MRLLKLSDWKKYTMSFKTPCLFIIYKRPEMTKIVFDEIRKIKPQFIYIAADGPRRSIHSEEELCLKTREIVKSIDWDCAVKTLFQEEHRGCKKAVSAAVAWFFDHVEEGIILEDDCLPNASFYPFCQELLEKYRSENRIMMISGFNAVQQAEHAGKSYHFSHYGSIWGWATWKRAWRYFDPDMKRYRDQGTAHLLEHIIRDKREYKTRMKLFEATYNGRIDSWGYAWSFARLINGGLSIVPKVNLVSNIGYGMNATHTLIDNPRLRDIPVLPLDYPLQHPEAIAVNAEYDRLLFAIYNPSRVSRISSIITCIIKKPSLLVTLWCKLMSKMRSCCR
jgi:hypothetical protein